MYPRKALNAASRLALAILFAAAIAPVSAQAAGRAPADGPIVADISDWWTALLGAFTSSGGGAPVDENGGSADPETGEKPTP